MYVVEPQTRDMALLDRAQARGAEADPVDVRKLQSLQHPLLCLAEAKLSFLHSYLTNRIIVSVCLRRTMTLEHLQSNELQTTAIYAVD